MHRDDVDSALLQGGNDGAAEVLGRIRRPDNGDATPGEKCSCLRWIDHGAHLASTVETWRARDQGRRSRNRGFPQRRKKAFDPVVRPGKAADMTTGTDTRIDVRRLRDADVEAVEEMS